MSGIRRTMWVLMIFCLAVSFPMGQAEVMAQIEADQPGGTSCGGDPSGSPCQRCVKELIGIDPSGEAIYQYSCIEVTPSPLFNSSHECTAKSNGCTQSDWCLIA